MSASASGVEEASILEKKSCSNAFPASNFVMIFDSFVEPGILALIISMTFKIKKQTPGFCGPGVRLVVLAPARLPLLYFFFEGLYINFVELRGT